jgi:hypothetical protein
MATSELRGVSFSKHCLGCQSEQGLDSRFVAFGRDASPRLEFWSVSLCKSCHRERHVAYLNARVKIAAAWVGGSVLATAIGLGSLGVGPARPPEGLEWTPLHIDWIVLGIAAGFAGVLAFPVLVVLLAKALIIRVACARWPAYSARVADETYTFAVRALLGKACAKLAVPLPFASRYESDYQVIGTGQTAEDAVNAKWAMAFVSEYPDTADLAEAACDRRLATTPLYFPGLLVLSGILLAIDGAFDLGAEYPLLGIAGVVIGIVGAGVAFIVWMEGFRETGFNQFRVFFHKGLFASRSLRRFWLALAGSVLVMFMAVPAFIYGARTHPYLTYHSYYGSDFGSRLTLEYPRAWRDKRSILALGPDDHVSINIFPDPNLPRTEDELLVKMKAQMERDKAAGYITHWRVDTVASASGPCVLTDERDNKGRRTETVYVPNESCCHVLRMVDPDASPGREQEFMQMVRSLRVIPAAGQPRGK